LAGTSCSHQHGYPVNQQRCSSSATSALLLLLLLLLCSHICSQLLQQQASRGEQNLGAAAGHALLANPEANVSAQLSAT
jgi:hypothetical protein